MNRIIRATKGFRNILPHQARYFSAQSSEPGFVTDRADLKVNDEQPRVAKRRSFKVELKKGETYYYCTCGYSDNQPFCDGSHSKVGSDFRPLKYTHEEEDTKRGMCGCKRNTLEKGPFCDGSHKTIDFD